MVKLECPRCKSIDVEVHVSCDANGKLDEKETAGKCKACGYQLSFKEIKAALGLE